MLEVKNLTVRYGDLTIVDGLSFSLAAGEWLMIVGPNGAGKSTLINAISQGADYGGEVLFQGRDLARLRPKERARRIGVLDQSHQVSYGFTVREVVGLGRYAYGGGLLASPGPEDEEKIALALEQTGLSELAGHSLLTLSGGELQRVFLAQLFAQEPRILLLDEPTNHLDLVYQQHVFELVQEWLSQGERAVLSVVHDLSLARAYGGKALLLRQGKTLAYGRADQVFSPEALEQAYDMNVYNWMNRMYSQWNRD